MNDDLISREALKKAFEDTVCIEPMPYAFVKQIVENAPTVEACSIIDGLNDQIDDLSENLAWYINERNRLLKERRPHGKWIGEHFVYKCSKCGHIADSVLSVTGRNTIPMLSNYCPECGADMGGGAE